MKDGVEWEQVVIIVVVLTNEGRGGNSNDS